MKSPTEPRVLVSPKPLVFATNMSERKFWGPKTSSKRALEVHLPQDWTTIRTILIFAIAAKGDRPKTGDQIYFEIPAGIEQIESLRTETHLFLFDTLPTDPREALNRASSAVARYKCKTLGAENRQGNLEVCKTTQRDSTVYNQSPPSASIGNRKNPTTRRSKVFCLPSADGEIANAVEGRGARRHDHARV